MAIEHANRVLDWQEHLRPKEIPPQWMWPLDDEIAKWLDEVMEARNEGRSDDDSSSPNARRERTPMMSNELAEGMRK